MFANYYHSFNKLGAFQRDDLVDALVVVEQVVNAEFLHGQSQVDHRAAVALDTGILCLDHLQNLCTVQRLHLLTLLRFPEADADNLSNVLLLHVIQVELLNPHHLGIVVPVGSLQFPHLMQHLRIQLLIVYLARIVYQLTLGNSQTDISTATRSIRQRMRVVGGGNERGETRTVFL